MANYHLQFDDNDVKSGLLNVDPDGCLKGVTPEKVLFTEKRNGVTYCCGIPAREMTFDEAYELTRSLVPNLLGSSEGIVAMTMYLPSKQDLYAIFVNASVSGSGSYATVNGGQFMVDSISASEFKSEE